MLTPMYLSPRATAIISRLTLAAGIIAALAVMTSCAPTKDWVAHDLNICGQDMACRQKVITWHRTQDLGRQNAWAGAAAATMNQVGQQMMNPQGYRPQTTTRCFNSGAGTVTCSSY